MRRPSRISQMTASVDGPHARHEAGPARDSSGKEVVALYLLTTFLSAFLLFAVQPLIAKYILPWFARMHPGVSPYRLYAVSNVGSLLALLSYPFIVEPRLSLRVQAQVWSWAYGGFALAGAACAAASWGRTPRVEVGPAASPTPSEQLLWLGLAACPSIMLLATTNQLCQDVGVVPFLWILPLGLYLLSFVVCFENPRWYSRRWWHPAFGVALVAGCVVVTLVQSCTCQCRSVRTPSCS